MTDWSDVREQLTAPDAFRYAPGVEPPLAPAELAELEAQLRVTLPEEYRSFLLQVSRGGAGPHYGLFPLRRVDGRWRWQGDGADLTALDTLDRPFPHTEAFNPADALPPQPDDDAFDSEEAFNEAEDAWWKQHDTLVYDPAHTTGALYLSHAGCALREFLVVSGPARGTMWADDTADLEGFSPLLDDDGTPVGFARWYRRWLTEAQSSAVA